MQNSRQTTDPVILFLVNEISPDRWAPASHRIVTSKTDVQLRSKGVDHHRTPRKSTERKDEIKKYMS